MCMFHLVFLFFSFSFSAYSIQGCSLIFLSIIISIILIITSTQFVGMMALLVGLGLLHPQTLKPCQTAARRMASATKPQKKR
jgi:hypothetical protein